MKKKNKTLYLVQGAVIAALYVAMNYLQELLLPGTTSMAVQFRAAEVLTVLAFFTPAAIPGLTIGCVLANVVSSGALPVDMVFGALATLFAVLSMYRLRAVRIKGIPLAGLLMPAVFNGLIIGWEIEVFFIKGSFHFMSFMAQAGTVALGELGVLLVLGLPLTMLLQKRGLDKKMFRI